MEDRVPIPRLPRERLVISGRRISRACDACRERKSKCDGNRPRCSQCTAKGLTICVYSDKKTIRLQKELQSEQRKSETYKELLQDLSVEFEGPIADRIRGVLKQEKPQAGATKHRRKGSNASSSSSMGSLEDVDVASEDFNRDDKSRSTGYMGKNSEIVWMQRLAIEATRQSDDKSLAPTSSRQHVPDDSLSSTNYHLDEKSLKCPAVPNAFILPRKSLSDKLFQIYLDKVQISLPFIRQDLFCAQYHRCFQSGLNPGGKWLAILNLVLAIGSAITRLSGNELSGGDEDIFFARAKILSDPENILYQHDDLQQVQIELLIAFYFLTISQINRSWKMIGIAARSGISLGINLHKKHNGLDAESEEARKQLWWSIFRLEHLLSVMTGRASCIGSGSSSLPPPLPLPSLTETRPTGQQTEDIVSSQLDQLHWTMQTNARNLDFQSKFLNSLYPSASLYHFYMVDLSLIAHTISSGVYSTQIHRTDWGRIESRISLYNKRMDQWLSRLNAAFQFQDSQSNTLSTVESPFQMSLALSYYSTRIVLNRPCLNRPAFEKSTGARLARSRFSNISALACLQSSMAIITLLPDEASLNWAYQLLQWWDIVHVLTQATVILLLDISIGPVPTKTGETHVVSESVEDVLKAAKKGIHWLQCLGATSESAQRSFEFANRCVHRLTAAKKFDLSDIPPEAHRPHTGRNTEENKDFRSAQSNKFVRDAEKHMPEDFASPEESHSEKIVQNQVEEDFPAGRGQTFLSLYDCDVDMPDLLPDLQDSEFEELLLSMMAS